MTPAKLNVFFAMFCYGGNGGVAMQLPHITVWFAKLFNKMKNDERIGHIAVQQFGDVPLTMERNRVVATAKAGGFDVIIMLDSDNVPDLYLGHRDWAKPFFETSFDFAYERKMRGVPTVICSPYCGPPPHPVNGGEENVYVFHPENYESGSKEPHFSFTGYTRTHAAQMRGIQSIAAGPTGVIMYTTDAFDLMPVRKQTQSEILDDLQANKITKERAIRLMNMKSWFFYEFTDQEQTRKASTEDVTNTREIQLAGIAKHGEPVVFCNWDAWAGHYKPKCVGMPDPIYMEQINDMYKEAVSNPVYASDQRVQVDFTGNSGAGGSEIGSDNEVASDEDAVQAGAEVIDEIARSAPAKAGVPMVPRMLFGRRVVSVGHITPMKELSELAEIVNWKSQLHPDRAIQVAEIGSWVGESAIAMASGFGNAGGTVFCVDEFKGSPNGDVTGNIVDAVGSEEIKNWFVKNTGDLLNSTIKLIEKDSVRCANEHAPQSLDLVFIDGNHDYEAVNADIIAWMKHVADDGVLIGHDYCNAFPGVMKAVDELFALVGAPPNIVDGTSIWFFRKSLMATAGKAPTETAAV